MIAVSALRSAVLSWTSGVLTRIVLEFVTVHHGVGTSVDAVQDNKAGDEEGRHGLGLRIVSLLLRSQGVPGASVPILPLNFLGNSLAMSAVLSVAKIRGGEQVVSCKVQAMESLEFAGGELSFAALGRNRNVTAWHTAT